MLEAALRKVVGKSLKFRSVAVLGTNRITMGGGVDPGHEATGYTARLDGPAAQTMSGDLSFARRIRGSRLYSRATSGPLAACWLDFGPGSAPANDSGLRWMPSVVSAVFDATPLGLADDMPDTIIAEIPARELLNILMWRFMDDVSDQLTSHELPVRVWIGLVDGRPASMRFRVHDAVHALEKDGVDVLSTVRATADYVGLPDTRIRKSFEKFITGEQTTTFSYGRVRVPAPRADELMDASDISETSTKQPEICAAAQR